MSLRPILVGALLATLSGVSLAHGPPPPPTPIPPPPPPVIVTGSPITGAPDGLRTGRPLNPRARNTRAVSMSEVMGWESWWYFNCERFFEPTANSEQPKTRAFGQTEADERARLPMKLRQQIVPILRRSLIDSDPGVRIRGVYSLAKVGSPAGVNDVLRVLGDRDPRVRHAAVVSLGLLGNSKAAPILESILRDGQDGRKWLGVKDEISLMTRSLAASAIGLLGAQTDIVDTPAYERLLSVIEARHGESELAVSGLIAMGLMRSAPAVPRLIKCLNDTKRDASIRGFAANALGKIGDRSAIKALLAAMKDGYGPVRHSAVISLGLLGAPTDREVVAALDAVADKGADRGLRHFSIIALGEIGGVDARNRLARLVRKGDDLEQSFAAIALGIYCLEHDDPEEQELGELVHQRLKRCRNEKKKGAFYIALGLMGHDDAAPALRSTLNRKGRQWLRTYAGLGLGLMRHDAASDDLLGIMKSPGDPSLRSASSIALGLIGNETALDVMRKVMIDEGPVAARGATLHDLGRTGDDDTIWELGRLLGAEGKKRERDVVRAFAARALGLLGDRSDQPLLASISRDSNYLARRGAVVSLYGEI